MVFFCQDWNEITKNHLKCNNKWWFWNSNTLRFPKVPDFWKFERLLSALQSFIRWALSMAPNRASKMYVDVNTMIFEQWSRDHLELLCARSRKKLENHGVDDLLKFWRTIDFKILLYKTYSSLIIVVIEINIEINILAWNPIVLILQLQVEISINLAWILVDIHRNRKLLLSSFKNHQRVQQLIPNPKFVYELHLVGGHQFSFNFLTVCIM